MKLNLILLFSILLVHIAVAIVIRTKLPNKNKTLKYNLNVRRNLYAICWLVDCLQFLVYLEISSDKQNDILNSNWYFVCLIVIAIFLFAVLYYIDKIAIRKNFEPYVSSHIEEYEQYKEKDINGLRWTSLRCAIMTTLFAMLPIAVLLDSFVQ